MATLLTLRRRIKTARNVSKTTKAMQMIAASKLKRAQDAAMQSKPYVEELEQVSKQMSARIDKDNLHQYMVKQDNINPKLYIVISPDKGLCGGLVTNLVREVIRFEGKDKNYFLTIGKKAQNFVAGANKEIIASFSFGTTLPSFDIVYPVMQIINEYFLGKKVSEVIIVTTKFVNVFSQIPQISNLLPVKLSENETGRKESTMIFEPDVNDLLPDLLQRYIEMMLYQGVLESYASEQASRMIAMKNATDNAYDIIDTLKLMYNKSRQEKITNELLDITGGMQNQYG
ncbi:MAG: ATP synthase F1 subunit gamma [Candidatus Levybacteria bacterium]|nr:ATP synthase F1 subunit gamma [Candidatus Levybacteria bacterium]